MENFSRTDAATSLRLLSEVAAARVADLEQYNDDDGLTTESDDDANSCLLYTSPSPRDQRGSRMPSSA